jgi:hypothetical protein
MVKCWNKTSSPELIVSFYVLILCFIWFSNVVSTCWFYANILFIYLLKKYIVPMKCIFGRICSMLHILCVHGVSIDFGCQWWWCGITVIYVCLAHVSYALVHGCLMSCVIILGFLQEGSKLVTRSQNNYFGNLKETFICKWNFEWDFL